MRKIAVLNQKGGVGKTTTSVNLAAALARHGQAVLLADLDPQAHASLHLSSALQPSRAPGKSIYDVFTAGTPLADVRQAAGVHLQVVPADIDLAAVEMELAGSEGRETLLRDRLAEDELEPDYVIIDCPPSLGVLTLNALSAADEVIIPLQPHFLALHGLSKLLETIELVSRQINPRLKLGGVVLCMYDTGTRLAAEVGRDVDEFLAASRGRKVPWADARVFETRIRRNIRLAEAPSFGRSIFDYAPDSHGAYDYEALADEYLHAVQPAAARSAA